jgi:hypothetical protein
VAALDHRPLRLLEIENEDEDADQREKIAVVVGVSRLDF